MSWSRFLCCLFAALMICGAGGCSSEPDGSEAQDDDATGEEDQGDDYDDDQDSGRAQDASSGVDAARDAGRDTGAAQGDLDAGARTDAGPGTDSAARDASGAEAGAADAGGLPKFSFFMTSLRAMRELSGDQNGFGGDLRFGEIGEGAGLRGADKICATIAEMSMEGSSAKQWRAFLSATTGGPNGGPVNAIDRVGEGPWYDRLGRVLALKKADLAQVRPSSADNVIKNDLPNEDGVLNHAPDGMQVDNHHVLTGSNDKGQLYANDPSVTCDDWTKSAGENGDAPRVGLSWPRAFGGGGGGANAQHWISALDESGCAPGVSIVEMGGPVAGNPTVGSGGGYGAIYCFALTP